MLTGYTQGWKAIIFFVSFVSCPQKTQTLFLYIPHKNPLLIINDKFLLAGVCWVQLNQQMGSAIMVHNVGYTVKSPNVWLVLCITKHWVTSLFRSVFSLSPKFGLRPKLIQKVKSFFSVWSQSRVLVSAICWAIFWDQSLVSANHSVQNFELRPKLIQTF